MEETEEAYSTVSDLQMKAEFSHAHPMYYVSSFGYKDWPVSIGGLNGVSSTFIKAQNGTPPNYPNTFCPQIYSITVNNFDERTWYAGSPNSFYANPGRCTGILFPSQHIYSPIIKKN
jgi:hypothetical protein